MRPILNRRKSVSSCRWGGTVACAFLVLATVSTVLGQDRPIAGDLLTSDSEDLSPPLSEPDPDQSTDAAFSDLGNLSPCCHSRWTASAEAIVLDRIGSVPCKLVETVPHSVHYKDLPHTFGPEVLNAKDLDPSFALGPRVGLTRHGDDGCDLELSYFQIDGWNAYRSIGPTPDDWLIMRASSNFLQTQDHKHTQMMAWDYASRLYNAELNVRWNPCARLTLLAGFRWANLSEELLGTLPELSGTWPQRRNPFWNTDVANNLYGFQIGADGTLFERGRFSINGQGKAGIFLNNAAETTGVSIARTVYWESDSTNQIAFLGETGLQCKYQVTHRLALKMGYEAMWLQGVALAPGQISETYCFSAGPHQTYVDALGVNSRSGVFYHGATAGLDYSF
jgi:hypothetical protein